MKKLGKKGQKLAEEIVEKAGRDVRAGLALAIEKIDQIPENQRASFFGAVLGSWAALERAPQYIDYIPEKDRVRFLTDAMDDNPRGALQHAQRYIEYIPEDQRAELLIKAMNLVPDSALRVTSKYIEYIPKDQRADILIETMNKIPFLAFENVSSYRKYILEDQVTEEEFADILIDLAKENPVAALWNLSKYIKYIPESERHDLIIDAMKKAPGSSGAVLMQAQNIIGYIPDKWRRTDIFVTAMENAPAAALENFSKYYEEIPGGELPERLVRAMEEAPQAAMENVSNYRSYIEYVPKDQKKELLEQAADKLIVDLKGVEYQRSLTVLKEYLPLKKWATLKNIARRENEYTKIAAEINRLHDVDDEDIRFASVKDFESYELYNLMVFGRDEVYTSTYLGVFDRFMARMEEEGETSIFDVADATYQISPVVFLEQAVEYDKLGEALSVIPGDKWRFTREQFALRIEAGKTSSAAAFAEVIHEIDNPAIKEDLEQFLQEKCNNTQSQEIRDIYSVIASYYNQISGGDIITLDDPERYKIKPIEELTKEDVFGSDGIHRQLVVFSGDRDGKGSFTSFMNKYKNNNNYKIRYCDGYVKITADAKDSKIEIYANDPSRSPDKIIEDITGKKGALPEEVEFDAVIHRGHSYNIKNTLPYISESTRFVSLGSCGGFNNIDTVMDKSPYAQILSTKQVGTRQVNDPVLFHINEAIRRKESVVWEKEQKYLNRLSNENKEHYVLPHKNAALSIKRKLIELEDIRQEEQTPKPQLFEDWHLRASGNNYDYGEGATYTGDKELLAEAVRVGAVSVDPALYAAGETEALQNNVQQSALFHSVQV